MSEQSKKFMAWKNLRYQQPDEIILDVDDRTENGSRCLSDTGFKLIAAGYHIEMWYADGMKQPHIHIPKVFNLNDLSKTQVVRYKKAFIKKYISPEFYQPIINDDRKEIPDLSLAEEYEELYHPVPIECNPHHKYKTPYLKVSEFNTEQLFNFTEPELLLEALMESEEKKFYPVNLDKKQTNLPDKGKAFLYQKIASKISISAIADAFGLAPLGKKIRQCPFHGDTNASLSINDSLGLFNCFGCRASGNIIKFYAMLKAIKPGFEFHQGQTK